MFRGPRVAEHPFVNLDQQKYEGEWIGPAVYGWSLNHWNHALVPRNDAIAARRWAVPLCIETGFKSATHNPRKSAKGIIQQVNLRARRRRLEDG